MIWFLSLSLSHRAELVNFDGKRFCINCSLSQQLLGAKVDLSYFFRCLVMFVGCLLYTNVLEIKEKSCSPLILDHIRIILKNN